VIIDAVITWVDGEDPRHIAKRNQILGIDNLQRQKSAARVLGSVNEISYTVESILKFAPFVRKIFIVTDEQIPEIFHTHQERITIVDHKEIFRGYEQVLPTINIRSIESMLYRIPGLAENFIYFNDDFFIIKSTKPEDWFIDSTPVIRGRWETPSEKLWYKQLGALVGIRKEDRAGFRKSQANAARLVGFENKFFRCYHTPRALRKSTFESYFASHPDLLLNQIQHRTRHATQFNPYALAWHLELKNKTAHTAAPGVLELHHPDEKSVSQLEHILHSAQTSKEILFMNIQNLNVASTEQQQTIFNWLNAVIR